MKYDGREWLEFCSQQLVSGLTSNDALRKVTDNPDLIGAYAESSIREFIRRFVAPLKLSTGSIVYEGNAGGKIPQLDGIIWHPSPLPPILEAGEFALVPRSAGLAYLEIKRSNYTGVGGKLQTTLNFVDELVPVWADFEPNGKESIPRSLGVICLNTAGTSDVALEELIRTKKVAVILTRESNTSEYRPNCEGVLCLVNFLMGIRYRATLLDGRLFLSLPKAPGEGNASLTCLSDSYTPSTAISERVVIPPSGLRYPAR